jgi:acyl-CoA synthetase (NDP forming)
VFVTAGLFRDLSPLLNPTAIAVVGASERHGTPGRVILENLRHLCYRGGVYPVNPNYKEILGWPCYPDLKSLPGPVEAVAILLGAEQALSVLETAGEIGARAAWVLAVGFAEAGTEGKARQARLSRLAEDAGLLVCGPNCIGVANLVDGAAMYSVPLSPKNEAGGVSVISQSGAVCMGLANAARFGLRYLISTGNEAVLDSSDYIGHLVNDPYTKVIVAFLEGIRSPQKFAAAASAAADAGKPILALKVGRSDQARRTVQAHTGSLAGADAVVDAFFRGLGVVRLSTLNELLEAATLFDTCPRPQGDGAGLLSLSGGQVGLVADLAQEVGLVLPTLSEDTRTALSQILPYTIVGNPLDVWGAEAREGVYASCVDIVSRDEAVHLLAVTRDTPPAVAPLEVEQSLVEAEAAVQATRETGKPVLMFSNPSSGFHEDVKRFLDEGGVPYLQGTRATLRAIKGFLDYGRFRRRIAEARAGGCPSPTSLPAWRERLQRSRGGLSETDGRHLLATYGIQGPGEELATTEEEAARAAQRIGYPVVLKIVSPDIQHKTEIGGVRVGLADETSVATSFREVMAAGKLHCPDARLDGALVQEMITVDAIEVILGILRDPDFGPVVVFGSGGTLVEVVKDSSLRLPPLNSQEALEMIQETRGARLLQGFRGRPPADVDALVDAVVRLSQLAVDLGDLIAALDVNPLMVLPKGQGVRAVDAAVELAAGVDASPDQTSEESVSEAGGGTLDGGRQST